MWISSMWAELEVMCSGNFHRIYAILHYSMGALDIDFFCGNLLP
jgi:hypothetical protein